MRSCSILLPGAIALITLKNVRGQGNEFSELGDSLSMFVDLNEFGGVSFPTLFSTPVDGNIFFQAQSNDEKYQLWKTDGTREGTRFVETLNVVVNDDDDDEPFVSTGGDKLYFAGRSQEGETDQQEQLLPQPQLSTVAHLWQARGSTGKARLIHDAVSPYCLQSYGTKLFFHVDNEEPVAHHLKTNETVVVADGNTATSPDYFSDLVINQDFDIAPASSGSDESEPEVVQPEVASPLVSSTVWVSDGTHLFAGCMASRSFCPVRLTGLGLLFGLVENMDVNGRPMQGACLWITDGTVRGTTRIAEMGTFPIFLTEQHGGAVVDFPFVEWSPELVDPIDGTERRLIRVVVSTGEEATGLLSWDLWVTNGTAQGSLRYPNSSSNSGSEWEFAPTTLSDGASLLLLQHHESLSQLWVTRGTPDDLILLGEFEEASAQKVILLDAPDLFLTWQLGMLQLWTTDGTVDGTRAIFEFPTAISSQPPKVQAQSRPGSQRALLFLEHLESGSSSSSAIWITDKTRQGTIQLQQRTNAASTVSSLDQGRIAQLLNESAVLFRGLDVPSQLWIYNYNDDGQHNVVVTDAGADQLPLGQDIGSATTFTGDQGSSTADESNLTAAAGVGPVAESVEETPQYARRVAGLFGGVISAIIIALLVVSNIGYFGNTGWQSQYPADQVLPDDPRLRPPCCNASTTGTAGGGPISEDSSTGPLM